MSECEFIDKLSHDGWNCPNCRDDYRARKDAEREKLERLIREAKADAWDEGVAEVLKDMRETYEINIVAYGPNPYRDQIQPEIVRNAEEPFAEGDWQLTNDLAGDDN